jgi:membrane fusion protein, multidrug efflux system
MKRTWLLGAVILTVAGRCPAIDFGYTEPNRIAQAAFAETGVIAEISVKEGMRVKEGRVLARLNSETLVQELRIAEEQNRLQQLRFDQIKALHDAGNGSKEELERNKSDLAITSLRVQRILAQINDRTLRAPFAGIVTKINREVSESVSAAQTEVMTIVQLDSLRVTVNLPVKIAGGLEVGAKTALILDENKTATGTVEFVSPVIDAASRTVRVTFVIPNAGGEYRSGVRCTLETMADGAGKNGEAAGEDAPLPERRPRATP